MNKIITILLFVVFGLSQLFGQNTFSKEQIQEDLDYLRLNLQKYHPNLFVYSTEEKIDTFFENLSFSDRLDIPQSFNLVSSISSIVKDGHFVVQPAKETLNQFYTRSKLFPLDIHWIGKDAYITRNYSNNDEIVLGDQVFSINGIEIDEIRETILNNVLRDGNNTTYPEWILNNFLRAYYNFCFGDSDVYKIEVGKNNLHTKILTINGLRHKKISDSRKMKYPQYAQEMKEEKRLELEIKEDSKSALLTIRSFENKILKKSYGQNFKKSIKGVSKK